MGRTFRVSQRGPRKWREIMTRGGEEDLPFARFFEEAVSFCGAAKAAAIEDRPIDYGDLWGADGALIKDWFAEGEVLHLEEDLSADGQRAGTARRLR